MPQHKTVVVTGAVKLLSYAGVSYINQLHNSLCSSSAKHPSKSNWNM